MSVSSRSGFRGTAVAPSGVMSGFAAARCRRRIGMRRSTRVASRAICPNL
jgi:hypothetical protein